MRIVLGVAAGVVVLAVVGFAVGWALRGAAPVPAAHRPSTAPATSAADDGSTLGPLVLPDYAGQDFVGARQRMRDLQLGVQLVFAAQGDSRMVERTEPVAGTPVRAGITVKVYVSGAAPELVLPDVVGRGCNEGGKALADAGLYPRYPTGRQGTVAAQDPGAGAPGVHWNDQIALTCTGGGSSPPTP